MGRAAPPHSRIYRALPRDGHPRDRHQLPVLERCSAYREFRRSKLTEKRRASRVRLEVSAKRELAINSLVSVCFASQALDILIVICKDI